ncbi:MAG TPA: type II toxin-antitoxin system RelB/DinJ family antitoxin [Agitococcus sp.]|nr:type II toxin-antitoxin system RelB/DinJ family antitoxin [Agitococcus sp.]HNC03791.1 type II toxin-antitoxin system RelB/DinJ family antitoxin [Agitococcus sp.]HNH43209.1 type II toxin-antitoxin system RelB/DinJ family antitoxin [Agitococcus sp.]HNN30113.1 type II toxin-antitoxin system RelB/DinJ family antitoxin [Agitococcus sp.]
MHTHKAEIVRARIAPDIKHNAEQVLASLGMSMSDAIRIFVSQVAIRQSFPIELKTPNQITLEAMQAEAEQAEYTSASTLFDELSHVDD